MLAGGCGGTAPENAAAPTLPAPLAEDLAARADAVANQLAAGDACAAAAEADDLVHAAVRAVQEGRVPAELQEELVSSTQELVHRIDCPIASPTPEPPSPAPPREDDREDDDDDQGKGEGKGDGEGKGKGKGKGRDEDKDD